MATVRTGPGLVDPLAPEEHAGQPARLGLGPGLVAGATMLVILSILSLARGRPLFEPVDLIASTVLGPAARAGGPVATLVGLAVHFGLSAALGALFVRLVGRTTRRRQLGLGLGYGLGLWGAVQFVLLPLLVPAVATHLGVVGPFLLGHVGYGLMHGASVPAVRDIDAPARPYIDPLRREVRP